MNRTKKFIPKEFLKPELTIYEQDKDLEVVDKMLDFKSGRRIKINLKIADNTKDYWKLEHMGNPKYSRSLIGAYAEMKKNWIPKLEQIFKEEGVPEKYFYLAIPESYWKLNDESHAGAKDPYQFTSATARQFGLRVDKYIDERTNPLKSGRACAKYLKYLHDRTHDWDLALSGYNGSLVWDYLKKCRNENKDSNYCGFLAHLEKEANQYKLEYQTGIMTYEVKKDERVKDISEKYRTSEKKIK